MLTVGVTLAVPVTEIPVPAATEVTVPEAPPVIVNCVALVLVTVTLPAPVKVTSLVVESLPVNLIAVPVGAVADRVP